jgi:Tol biopolymer transport system component
MSLLSRLGLRLRVQCLRPRIESGHSAVLMAIAAILALCAWIDALGANDPEYPLLRMPGTIFLEGYYAEYVVTPTRVIHLKSPSGRAHFESLSHDGQLVAGVICKADHCSVTNQEERDVIAIFSTASEKWTEYAEALHIGAVSISPDESKLAFGNDQGLHVLEMRTGLDRLVVSGTINIYVRPSWSPDGKRIVYQVNLDARDPHIEEYASRINAVDITSQQTWTVATDAQDPAWSPSGDWIAYVNTSGSPGGSKCMLVHPDGSGKELAATAPREFFRFRTFFGWRGNFLESPVWSPDSKKLLLSVYWDWETLTTDVYELDIARHKLARKIKKGAPVWGWAESRQDHTTTATRP